MGYIFRPPSWVPWIPKTPIGPSSVQHLARTASDAPATTDSVIRILVLLRTDADSPTTIDSLARIETLVRTLGDSPQSATSLSIVVGESASVRSRTRMR